MSVSCGTYQIHLKVYRNGATFLKVYRMSAKGVQEWCVVYFATEHPRYGNSCTQNAVDNSINIYLSHFYN